MSGALYGTYYPSIDDKGRLSFPKELRDILGPEFYLCAGYEDHYISVYSPEEFDNYQRKLSSIPGRLGSAIRRKLLSLTDKQIPDKQGRISIKDPLRKHALIEKDIIIVGSVTHAEIWDKATWEKSDGDLSFDQIAEALADSVI